MFGFRKKTTGKCYICGLEAPQNFIDKTLFVHDDCSRRRLREQKQKEEDDRIVNLVKRALKELELERLELPVRLGEHPTRYYNWKSHFSDWTKREEEIAHGAYIAGWYHRCNQDPDNDKLVLKP